MDIDGLRATLTALHAGEIKRVTRETPEPSVFAHEILNANPYAFLDDAPLEERRARAVTLRRGLPASVADDLGRLDPAAITAVVEEAWPDLRNADELHDLLLDLGALPERDAGAWTGYLEELIAAGRAARLRQRDHVFWVPAERRSLAATVWPRYRFEPDLVEPPARRAPAWSDRDGALVEIVRSRLGLSAHHRRRSRRRSMSRREVDAALARWRPRAACFAGASRRRPSRRAGGVVRAAAAGADSRQTLDGRAGSSSGVARGAPALPPLLAARAAGPSSTAATGSCA